MKILILDYVVTACAFVTTWRKNALSFDNISKKLLFFLCIVLT